MHARTTAHNQVDACAHSHLISAPRVFNSTKRFRFVPKRLTAFLSNHVARRGEFSASTRAESTAVRNSVRGVKGLAAVVVGASGDDVAAAVEFLLGFREGDGGGVSAFGAAADMGDSAHCTSANASCARMNFMNAIAVRMTSEACISGVRIRPFVLATSQRESCAAGTRSAKPGPPPRSSPAAAKYSACIDQGCLYASVCLSICVC